MPTINKKQQKKGEHKNLRKKFTSGDASGTIKNTGYYQFKKKENGKTVLSASSLFFKTRKAAIRAAKHAGFETVIEKERI